MPPKKSKKQCAAFAKSGECPAGDLCKFPHVFARSVTKKELDDNKELESLPVPPISWKKTNGKKQNPEQEKVKSVPNDGAVFERTIEEKTLVEESDGLKIVCLICGVEFVMNLSEQRWYLDKKFNVPKRCKRCRLKRQDQRDRFQRYQASHSGHEGME
jgi:hypothetical protein